MFHKDLLCPECLGAGVHNDGDIYTTCVRCDGFGMIDDDGLLDEDDDDILIGEDEKTSMTEKANILYVEDSDE